MAGNGEEGKGPLLVCVTGADGTGKTTLVDRAVKALAEDGLRAASSTIWDALTHPRTRELVPFRSRDAVYRYLSILSPPSRTLFFYHCLYQALDLARAALPGAIVLNGYWYKYYATEVARGGDADGLLRAAEGIFPAPALTVRLTLPIEVAFERKCRQGELSAYEAGFSLDAAREKFFALSRQANDAFDRLSARFGWVEVDASPPPDAVAARFVEAIRGVVAAAR